MGRCSGGFLGTFDDVLIAWSFVSGGVGVGVGRNGRWIIDEMCVGF